MFCVFLCYSVCLFLYGPFCHGALKIDIVYNILSLHITSIYIIEEYFSCSDQWSIMVTEMRDCLNGWNIVGIAANSFRKWRGTVDHFFSISCIVGLRKTLIQLQLSKILEKVYISFGNHQISSHKSHFKTKVKSRTYQTVWNVYLNLYYWQNRLYKHLGTFYSFPSVSADTVTTGRKYGVPRSRATVMTSCWTATVLDCWVWAVQPS